MASRQQKLKRRRPSPPFVTRLAVLQKTPIDWKEDAYFGNVIDGHIVIPGLQLQTSSVSVGGEPMVRRILRLQALEASTYRLKSSCTQ